MKKSYTIAITTFSKRFQMLETLVEQIRKHSREKILICVNGEKDGAFPDDYRRMVLNLCFKYGYVFPIFFIETRGLSKMWNTLISHSPGEDILLLNDDLRINTPDLFSRLSQHINSNDYTGFTVINESFSHFMINKKILDRLGYFDERLLGFGEEDGDMVFRCLDKGQQIMGIRIPGIDNIVSDIRHDHITPGVSKYSKFNKDFMFTQKFISDPDGKTGTFGTPMRQILPDVNFLPFEKFFMDHKSEL